MSDLFNVYAYVCTTKVSCSVMSSSTKRKHVYAEVLSCELRVPATDEEVVRVLAGRGNNLHEVETASGDCYLVSMPAKFRRNVWVKRGDYVLVQQIPEGDKVKYRLLLFHYLLGYLAEKTLNRLIKLVINRKIKIVGNRIL